MRCIARARDCSGSRVSLSPSARGVFLLACVMRCILRGREATGASTKPARFFVSKCGVVSFCLPTTRVVRGRVIHQAMCDLSGQHRNVLPMYSFGMR